jgi:AcrR family transcriptional regulator
VGHDERGIRARKKRQTRQAIARTAMDLFVARGFDGVTVADIAAAADVSVNTVFNYFRTKEEIFFERNFAVLDSFSIIVRTRNPGESVVEAFRRDFLNALERRDPALGLTAGTAEITRMVEASPSLQAKMRELIERREHALGRTLAAETGAPPHDLTARLVAAQLGVVHRVLCIDIHRRLTAGQPIEEVCARMVDEGIRAYNRLAAGIGDYGTRSAQGPGMRGVLGAGLPS